MIRKAKRNHVYIYILNVYTWLIHTCASGIMWLLGIGVTKKCVLYHIHNDACSALKRLLKCNLWWNSDDTQVVRARLERIHVATKKQEEKEEHKIFWDFMRLDWISSIIYLFILFCILVLIWCLCNRWTNGLQ